MPDANGFSHYLEIRKFRTEDEQYRYRRIIDHLVHHGHAFAVMQGKLFLSIGAVARLLEADLVFEMELESA